MLLLCLIVLIIKIEKDKNLLFIKKLKLNLNFFGAVHTYEYICILNIENTSHINLKVNFYCFSSCATFRIKDKYLILIKKFFILPLREKCGFIFVSLPHAGQRSVREGVQ